MNVYEVTFKAAVGDGWWRPAIGPVYYAATSYSHAEIMALGNMFAKGGGIQEIKLLGKLEQAGVV